MNINYLDTKKTALLFFDMLNVYYPSASDEAKKKMKPVVDNAVRLMNAARQSGILIYYAMANHRTDGESRSLVVTDTDMRLRPWPDGDCNPTVHGATEGSWEQKVIEEIAAQSDPSGIAKTLADVTAAGSARAGHILRSAILIAETQITKEADVLDRVIDSPF